MQSILGAIGLGPKKELHDLSGRVAMVVGGTRGIGFEIARGFFQANVSKVNLVGANPENGPESVDKFKKEFGASNVEWHQCDLENIKQIHDVFSRIGRTEPRLDILVLAAGLNGLPYNLNTDGIERVWGCNWLGNYFIINLLYPLIRKTAKIPNTPPARIVMVSSVAHILAPGGVKFASLDEINNDKLGPAELYGRSKLAIILGIRYLLCDKVIRPNGDNIYALAVHPGTVNTELQDQWKEAYPGLFGQIWCNFSRAIGRNPEQGACSALYAATSPEIEEKGWNGKYLEDPGEKSAGSTQANDPESAENLEKLSAKLIKEKTGVDVDENWTR